MTATLTPSTHAASARWRSDGPNDFKAKVTFETLIAESQLVLGQPQQQPAGARLLGCRRRARYSTVWLNELTACDEDLDLDSFLEEGTPSDAGGTEVHEGWRTGCSVTLYEIEGRYFVEWNADEGSTFGWEEVYCGSRPRRL